MEESDQALGEPGECLARDAGRVRRRGHRLELLDRDAEDVGRGAHLGRALADCAEGLRELLEACDCNADARELERGRHLALHRLERAADPAELTRLAAEVRERRAGLVELLSKLRRPLFCQQHRLRDLLHARLAAGVKRARVKGTPQLVQFGRGVVHLGARLSKLHLERGDVRRDANT
ncbi:MAG: hypothetical protein WAU56_07535 [Steroidobacteraceae bacterium]